MVVVSDAPYVGVFGNHPDAFWCDGYLEPQKRHQAPKCYLSATRKLPIRKGIDYYGSTLKYLNSRGGIHVHDMSLSITTPNTSYPALREEVVNDPQRKLYRALILIRTDRRAIKGLGKLRSETDFTELVEDLGIRIKEPNEYKDKNIEAFVSDCKRVLDEVAEPYREAYKDANIAMEMCLPGRRD
jgi:hypothetical protein